MEKCIHLLVKVLSRRRSHCIRVLDSTCEQFVRQKAIHALAATNNIDRTIQNQRTRICQAERKSRSKYNGFTSFDFHLCNKKKSVLFLGVASKLHQSQSACCNKNSVAKLSQMHIKYKHTKYEFERITINRIIK